LLRKLALGFFREFDVGDRRSSDSRQAKDTQILFFLQATEMPMISTKTRLSDDLPISSFQVNPWRDVKATRRRLEHGIRGRFTNVFALEVTHSRFRRIAIVSRPNFSLQGYALSLR